MVEIQDEVDIHSNNQSYFGLPERRIAKIFVFRLIYGGSAWSYCFDPDFNWISKDHRYWQKVIDKFYDKYKGINNQHIAWVQEVVRTGQLVMPTGRSYKFDRYLKNGEMTWPRNQIINYPVQGLANDLVTIARVALFRRVRDAGWSGVRFISTVHDSIVMELGHDLIRPMFDCVNGVFADIPLNFHRLFGTEFNMSVRAECSVGPNYGALEEIVDINTV